MTLKPYRFWLPPIALFVSFALIELESSLHAGNLLNFANELINFPASFALEAIPGCCVRGVYVLGDHVWLRQFLFFSLAALWWYVVGLEMDVGLLRLLALRMKVFRVCWLLTAILLQVLATALLIMFAVEATRHPSDPVYDYIFSTILVGMEFAWIEIIAWRFWRGGRAKL